MSGDGVLSIERHAPGAQPVFFYDLGSPEAYLAAERVNQALGAVPEWEPVLLADLPGAVALDAFRCAQERDVHMLDLERRAAGQGLQRLRWPPAWPFDSSLAMLVATYSKGIGRAVAFSLAAFRQAFAAGRDLATPDGVVIAAAACEMHPRAVLQAAELKSVSEALERANGRAAAAGVTTVPAILTGKTLHQGPGAVDGAAAALRAGAGAP